MNTPKNELDLLEELDSLSDDIEGGYEVYLRLNNAIKEAQRIIVDQRKKIAELEVSEDEIRDQVKYENSLLQGYQQMSLIKISEDQIHRQVIAWAKLQKCNDGRLADYLHHSPNGGKRDAREGAKFKQQGVLSGFPDLFLFIPSNGFHGLFLELKSEKGLLSENQAKILSRLCGVGYETGLAKSFEEAIKIITEYLKKKD